MHFGQMNAMMQQDIINMQMFGSGKELDPSLMTSYANQGSSFGFKSASVLIQGTTNLEINTGQQIMFQPVNTQAVNDYQTEQTQSNMK